MYVVTKLASRTSYAQDLAAPTLIRINGLTAAAFAAWLMLVLVSRSRGLRWHRGMELLAFGFLTLTRTGVDNCGYIKYGLPVQNSGSLFANASILHWFTLVALYGWLIPNTARRAALISGAMATVATVSLFTLWSRLGAQPGALASWLTSAMVYLGAATALTSFTAGRLEAARREIARARELGHYRLGRRLGGGGMGEVFLAEHRFLKRECAIKLIHPAKAASELFIRRFEREVLAVTRLTHPSAVQVYDYGRADDGALFFVMEYLPGLTLDQLVKEAGPLHPGRVISILRQVCGALSEAHALGLIHRDVKPSNIIVCRLGGRADVAKLLDFGLVFEPASRETRLTEIGGILGTPAYMCPEQARGEECGPKSDLYSLGAVGNFILTGRPPFRGENPLEILHAHQTQAVDPPSTLVSSVPSDLEQVILRLLAKSPADRFGSAAQVDGALALCAVCGWSDDAAADWWKSTHVASISAPVPGA
jgi:serine/threonine-protein kinase